jgi:hypothetical protein
LAVDDGDQAEGERGVGSQDENAVNDSIGCARASDRRG